MKEALLICIGKLKTPYWKNAAEHYIKLLGHWRKIELLELRDSTASPECRSMREEAAILQNINKKDFTMALAENGRQFDSRQFANFLRECDEIRQMRPAFIIGGPYGISRRVVESCACVISLSAMTWPHELARVLLLEQLYRAESILRATPYHH